MIRLLLSLVCLTLVYALALASFQPWDLAIGAAISGMLLLWFRRFLFGERLQPLHGLLRRMLAFVPFAGAVLYDILAGTWQVVLIVLHIRPLPRSGIIAVPIEDRTPAGVAISALATTLSPGAFLVDVDWEQRVMLFHVIDATDPDAVRADQQDFYRRYQRRVFP